MTSPLSRKIHNQTEEADGFTLAEIIVTVGLTAVLLSVYSIMLSGTMFLRRSQYNAQAASLIQEELDSLRLIPIPELLDRTAGNFLNVAVNRGDWLAMTKSEDGQGMRLTLPMAETPIIGETALMLLPTDWQSDFTFTAKVRTLTASPTGWGAGLVFRYRDTENHYRFRYTSGGLSLDVVRQGSPTTLWSQSLTMDKTAWYTLEVIANGSDLTIKRNGVLLTTVTDLTFEKGELGLFSYNGGLTEFDDISLTVGTVVSSWNFEANDDLEYPEDWRRLGWPDLPDGNGTLTITDYLDEPGLRQVAASISWNESGRTKTVTGMTVIGY